MGRVCSVIQTAVSAFRSHRGRKESVKKLGYVVVDLDEKMHASDNFMYLYDNTKRVGERGGDCREYPSSDRGRLQGYITTDHGNIETTAFRKLDNRISWARI